VWRKQGSYAGGAFAAQCDVCVQKPDCFDDDRLAIQPALTFRPDADTSITALGYFQRDGGGQVSQFLPYSGVLYPDINGRKVPQDRFIGEPNDHYDTDVNSATLVVEHKFNDVLKLQHSSRYGRSSVWSRR
jgi:iron complex outermembrane receptor protein